MKKFLAFVFILAVGLAIFSACEKDDICPGDTLTTPYLNIGFYNFNNQDAFKSATKLRIVGIDSTGYAEIINTFTDRSNQTQVSIPLNTAVNYSQFIFTFNSRDDEETAEELGNQDTLQFNYTRQEYFISRGCGYGVNFTDLATIINPAYKDTVQNTEEWIIAAFDQETNLQNQDTIHVKIYH
ncbi:DUF6452 family protein [Joostella sp. CR20]|uniref:DUF6452 family protein n=1 Tax=Joostella sp. CR20 TaxID=2804312 RepID=UPI00313B2A2C